MRDRETVMLSAFERREARISTIMSIECFSCYEKLITSTACHSFYREAEEENTY